MVYLVTQSCLTVCDPVDCSLPGSSLHGDSPSKNTGVAWHFFLQGSFLTWGLNWGLHHCRHSLPSEPPGKPENAGVGSLSLLQGIFLTQELNWNLLLCRWILYQLSHKGNPRILGWVAYPFSRGSSWCMDQTKVSCIAGRFFTSWAITEALLKLWMTAITQWL